MLNRLDPGDQCNYFSVRSIDSCAGAPGVFHQVSRWCSLLGSLQLLSLALPPLLPLTLMTHIQIDWGTLIWVECLLAECPKQNRETGGIYRGEPLRIHAEPLSRINRLTPRKLAGPTSLNLPLAGCDCQVERSVEFWQDCLRLEAKQRWPRPSPR